MISTKKDAHRYMYFDDCKLKAVRERITAEDEQYARLLKYAEVLLEEDFYSEEYANSEYTQHGKFYDLGHQLTAMAETLGFIYAVEGRKDCAQKLVDAMLHYADFECWAGPSNKDRETPWKSELSTTRLLYGMSLGIDYLYDYITAEQREKIIAGMIKNGIRPLLEDWVLPNTRIHALDSMGHNWWAVCIAFAGIALCIIKDEVAQYDEWMSQIKRALQEFCSYSGNRMFNKIPNFDSELFFYESIRYFNYGVGELLRFEYIYSRFCDASEKLCFLPHEKLAQAYLLLSYPADGQLQWVDFGDNASGDSKPQLPCYILLSGNIGDDVKRLLLRSYRQSVDMPTGVDLVYRDILWGDMPEGKMELPLVKVLEESGCGCKRTSWEDDATLFAVRCGYTWNHAHDDAGGFALYDRGKALLIDSGSCPYGDKLYHDYYTTGAAHSIVTADEKGQVFENTYLGSKFSGTLTRLDTADGLEIWCADATGPISNIYQRNYRHFIMLDDETTVILDELRAYEEHTYRWQLHYNGEATLEKDALHIDNGTSRMTVRTVSPENYRAELRDGYRCVENKPELKNTIYYGSDVILPKQKYLCVEYPERTRVAHFLHVLLLNEAESAEVESLSGTDWCGVKITRGSTVYKVYYNLRADGRNMHINTNNCIDGFETDAYMLVLCEKEGVCTWQTVCASYLRRDGESLYESFMKRDAYAVMD